MPKPKCLNAKQKLFVAHYLKSLNASEAARAAGYPTKTAGAIGAENLKKPLIKKAVDAAMAKRSAKIEIDADRVLKRIGDIAFDAKRAKNSDILRACELLGRHLKMFTDVHEHSGKDGTPLVVLTMPANGSEAKEEDGNTPKTE